MNLIDLFDKASESPEFIPKLRQLILDLAVRGKLVPQNSKDEPASELLKKIKAEKEGLVLKNIIRHGKTITQVNPDEIPYIVPNNWIWCKLGNLCYKITDGFHNTPPKVSAGRPYISATHIRSTGIAWDRCDYVSKKYHDELRSKTYPHKGEILVVNIGAGCGTSAIIDVDYEFSFKNIAILKFNQDLLLNKFINNFFLFKKKYLYPTGSHPRN